MARHRITIGILASWLLFHVGGWSCGAGGHPRGGRAGDPRGGPLPQAGAARDGSWADVHGEARTGTTSLVTLALLTAGEQPDSPTVRKAPRLPPQLRARAAQQHLRRRAPDDGLRRRRARARPDPHRSPTSTGSSGPRSSRATRSTGPARGPTPAPSGPSPATTRTPSTPCSACNAASEVGRAGQARGLGPGPDLLGAQPEARRELGLHARLAPPRPPA